MEDNAGVKEDCGGQPAPSLPNESFRVAVLKRKIFIV